MQDPLPSWLLLFLTDRSTLHKLCLRGERGRMYLQAPISHWSRTHLTGPLISPHFPYEWSHSIPCLWADWETLGERCEPHSVGTR